MVIPTWNGTSLHIFLGFENLSLHFITMRFSSELCLTATFALSALATPVMEKRATPTIYLAGDSTMANKGANDGATDGPSPTHHLTYSRTNTSQAGAHTSLNMSLFPLSTRPSAAAQPAATPTKGVSPKSLTSSNPATSSSSNSDTTTVAALPAPTTTAAATAAAPERKPVNQAKTDQPSTPSATTSRPRPEPTSRKAPLWSSHLRLLTTFGKAVALDREHRGLWRMQRRRGGSLGTERASWITSRRWRMRIRSWGMRGQMRCTRRIIPIRARRVQI